MSAKTTCIVGCIIVISLIGAAGAAVAQTPLSGKEQLPEAFRKNRLNGGLPIGALLEPVSPPTGPGPITLRLTIKPHVQCDAVQVSTTTDGPLEYHGRKEWEFSTTAGQETSFDLEVVVPPNDTCGLVVQVICNIPITIKSYFVTTDTSVTVYPNSPQEIFGIGKPGRRGFGVPVDKDGFPVPTEPVEQTVTIGLFDREGNFIPVDSIPPGMEVGHFDSEGNFEVVEPVRTGQSSEDKTKVDWGTKPVDPDVGYIKDLQGNWVRVSIDSVESERKQRRLEKRMEEMRELEKTPLVGYATQTFVVGETVYQRANGEYKFKVVEPVRDRFERGRALRKQWAENPELQMEKREFILDLRDPDHLSLAREILDTLIATDSAGYYRALLDRDQTVRLREAHVPLRRLRNTDGRDESSSADPAGDPDPLDEDGSGRLERATTVFLEDYEGVFPGLRWNVGDSAGEEWEEGEDYWGVTTCRHYGGGAKSVWCSGTGDAPHCDYYAWDMFAYMDMISPVYLDQLENLTLRYQIYYDTWQGDPVPDYMDVWYSPNLLDWYSLADYGGQSGTWIDTTHTLDVTGWTQLYVGFTFESYLYADGEDGVFIDNVRISADSILLPDLTYDTPGGWYGPIVPAATTGTFTLDTLWAGQTTYIDWAITNIGSAPDDGSWTALYIDGGYIGAFYHDPINPPGLSVMIDHPETINGAGIHSIAIEADYSGMIEEEDETNN